MKTITVMTTINSPGKTIATLIDNCNFTIIIGDKKTPDKKWEETRYNLLYIDIEKQLKGDFLLAKALPINHYSRKNVGYLEAIRRKPTSILDIDDDNYPYIEKGSTKLLIERYANCQDLEHPICSNEGFLNLFPAYYSIFNKKGENFIPLPRGLPLRDINNIPMGFLKTNFKTNIGIWQGILDGEPDLSASFRLQNPEYSIEPKQFRKIVISKDNYIPINSQLTLWSEEKLFPLLYLPSTVSFRFSDILRGYIALVIAFKNGYDIACVNSVGFQDRNRHDLLDDYRQEERMYNINEDIMQIIKESLKKERIEDNLIEVYEELERKKITEKKEISLLKLWLDDLDYIKLWLGDLDYIKWRDGNKNLV